MLKKYRKRKFWKLPKFQWISREELRSVDICCIKKSEIVKLNGQTQFYIRFGSHNAK